MKTLRELGELNREHEINIGALEFCHVAKWIAAGRGQIGNSVNLATNARATPRIIEAVKALASAGSTTDGAWAAPLAYQKLAESFLASLKNFGVFDSALPFAKPVPLNVQVTVVTLGATGSTVGQGQAKIISKLQLANTALTPRKAVAIIVTSDELLKMGGALASRLFAQELQRAVVAETDAQFLSVITAGITPVSSSGSTAIAIGQDFANAFAALDLGNDSKVFVAMNPDDVKHVAVQIASTGERAFPGVGIHGGDYAGATIIPSDAVSGQIIAFDATQIAMGSITIEIDSSNQAAIQMDSTPDSPPTASTNLVSLFQSNQTGLRAHRWFGCERLRTAAVSVISGVSYGSANSPA